MIHRLHHAAIYSHSLGLIALSVIRQGVPVFCGMHPRHWYIGWHQTSLYSGLATVFTQYVPAIGVCVHIAVDILLRCLNWHVHSLQGQIGEEWLTITAVTINKADKCVDEIAAGIEIFRQGCR